MTNSGSQLRRLFSIVIGALLFAGAAQANDEAAMRSRFKGMQHFSVACSITLQPDVVVIVGGISAKGQKAAEVGARLDQITQSVKQRAAELNGKVVLGDRLRGAKAATPRAEKDEPAPYVGVQLVEIEFPLSVDIDRMLDRLLPLGIDRFGKRIGLEASTETRPFVFYRVTGLGKSAAPVVAACKEQLLPNTCGNVLHPLCQAPAGKVQQCVQILAANLRAEVNDGRYRDTLSLEFPAMSVKPIESAGQGPFVFNGEVTVGYDNDCVRQ
jgi:hypothetical protein